MRNLSTQTKGGARALALCLVVMFAVSAIVAPGASAKLPEWGKCEAAAGHEGRYADAGCVVPVKKVYGHYTGGYEWQPISGEYNFRFGQIGPSSFETTTGKKIDCASGELPTRDAVQSPNRVREILLVFQGCESEGRVCSSKFQAPGELSNEVNWLNEEAIEGELVYLSGKGTTDPSVGLTLATEKAGQELFTVVCEGELGTVEIGGAGGKKSEKAKGNTVLGVFAPVDRMSSEFTQTFNQSAGVQEPVKAEKGKEKTLQMFLSNENKWAQLGLDSTFTYITEEGVAPVEIKAVP